MGTWFLVVYTAFQCPGGWFARYIPERTRPLICEPRTESVQFIRHDDALLFVNRLGPLPRPVMHWCQTGKCWTKKIEWKMIAEVK